VEPLAAVVVFEFFQEVGAEFGLQLVEVFLTELADFGGFRGGRGFQDFFEVLGGVEDLEIDDFVDIGWWFLVICCWLLLFAVALSGRVWRFVCRVLFGFRS